MKDRQKKVEDTIRNLHIIVGGEWFSYTGGEGHSYYENYNSKILRYRVFDYGTGRLKIQIAEVSSFDRWANSVDLCWYPTAEAFIRPGRIEALVDSSLILSSTLQGDINEEVDLGPLIRKVRRENASIY